MLDIEVLSKQLPVIYLRGSRDGERQSKSEGCFRTGSSSC